MDQEILNTFYNELLLETSTNKPVSIGDWKFNVNFSSSSDENINNGIIININNKEKFNEILIEYTKTIIEHIITNDKLKDIDYLFFNGNMHYMIKASLLNVWYNATEEDFKNPINYLKTRTDFINDNISKSVKDKTYKSNEIPLLKNLFIENKIDIQNPAANETPFVFKTEVVDENGNNYCLPSISYGISDGKCYIYSIKNDKRPENEFSKKVNRLLYKANKDLMYDYEEENIKDVSVSQLFSMTTFFKFLEDNNITDLVIKNYFPIRYEAKEITINKKLNKLNEKLAKLDKNSEDYQKESAQIEKLKEENIRIQNNIINKYLRIFRRLEYQFGNVHITSYPYELDNNMHIKISKYNNISHNHILNSIYENTNFIQSKNK